MKVVLQRVNSASVDVDGRIVGRIGKGILLFVGAAKGDNEEDVRLLVDKSLNLRIFEDDQGKMNLSCIDLGFEALVVSQFTLLADTRKGRRPSFTDAMDPAEAERLYDQFVKLCRSSGIRTESGVFAAKMKINIENWGPVTIIIDSKA
jgi:D-tyrosyl-tRNA(Tyr) deacylase